MYLKENEEVPLNECHLVIKTRFRNVSDQNISSIDGSIDLKSLKITIGSNEYDIVLEPFYDGYHGCWCHESLKGFKDGDDEIYVIIMKPGNWSNFKKICRKIQKLKDDTDGLFDETDVFYVNIPWTTERYF